MIKSLIVANWKMNPSSLAKAKALFDSITKGVGEIKEDEIVICPPYIYLADIAGELEKNKNSKLKLGAQDCFWEKEGAFTGEISPSMLRDLGCKYVILGHSERRKHLKEKSSMINKKLKLALEEGLNCILCVGENEKEKRKGEIQKVIRHQLEKGLSKVPKSKADKIVIAYEPVWAIGTGKSCKPVEAQVINFMIRKILTRIYDRSTAQSIRILYGGSVDREKASTFLKETEMKGVLIGGASLDSVEFIKIVKDVESF
ncbi:MAG: triose-phosphate isomerase [Candidatus Nealsonbacteria bacterium]|nr:triose-phosphate isomerase [Candidatus Nealsonbacteria bacterium]